MNIKKEMDISKVEEKQLEGLQKISIETFVETFSEYNTKEDMDSYIQKDLSKEKLKTELNHPGSEFYIAYINEEPAAYIKINFGEAQSDALGSDCAELQRIYVKKEFQGLKIGQKMLDFAIETAKERKQHCLWLGVWEHNHKAIHFYEKNGFIKFSEHPFILGTDKQIDYLYKLELL